MPLNYLSNQDQNIYAAGDIGRSWADAAIQARRMGLQQAIEMQRLGMERDRLGMEGQEQSQRMDFARQKEVRDSARGREELQMQQMARMALQQAAAAKGRMVPVDLSNGPTVAAAHQMDQRSLANALAVLAYQQPAQAGKALEPMEVGDKDVMDQITGQTIATGRMNPYQQAQVQQGERGLRIDQDRANAYIGEQGALRDLHAKQTQHPELFRRQDELAEILSRLVDQNPNGQKGTNAPNNSSQMFDSEDIARSQGAKAGDVVYLKGIGKVQLH